MKVNFYRRNRNPSDVQIVNFQVKTSLIFVKSKIELKSYWFKINLQFY